MKLLQNCQIEVHLNFFSLFQVIVPQTIAQVLYRAYCEDSHDICYSFLHEMETDYFSYNNDKIISCPTEDTNKNSVSSCRYETKKSFVEMEPKAPLSSNVMFNLINQNIQNNLI